MGTVLQGILWDIWKERNSRIFEDKKKGVNMVIDSILYEVASWLMVTNEFRELSLNTFMMDWVFCIFSSPLNQDIVDKGWEMPMEGKVKLNFDASSFGNSGPAVYEGVARHSLGKVLFALCGPLGICESTKVELTTLLKGL